nr:DNA repair protein SWI5 homolog [Jaculus jaculus]
MMKGPGGVATPAPTKGRKRLGARAARRAPRRTASSSGVEICLRRLRDAAILAPALEPPALQTPPSRGPRTPGLRRPESGLNRSCRGAFRSPRPSPKSGQADGINGESLLLDIQKLQEKRDMLDKEISQLISEGYNVDELEDHISQLHEYNDIKDIGQMLLGKLAVIRGVTTKELYPEFGLDMND